MCLQHAFIHAYTHLITESIHLIIRVHTFKDCILYAKHSVLQEFGTKSHLSDPVVMRFISCQGAKQNRSKQLKKIPEGGSVLSSG